MVVAEVIANPDAHRLRVHACRIMGGAPIELGVQSVYVVLLPEMTGGHHTPGPAPSHVFEKAPDTGQILPSSSADIAGQIGAMFKGLRGDLLHCVLFSRITKHTTPCEWLYPGSLALIVENLEGVLLCSRWLHAWGCKCAQKRCRNSNDAAPRGLVTSGLEPAP